MVSGSSRWFPFTEIERMVRIAGAEVASGVGRAVAGAGVAVVGAGVAVVGLCGGAAGGTWASSGAEVPPRIVPTISNAPVRRLFVFNLEITRPRLVRKRSYGALRRQAPVTALPQAS